MKGRAKGCGAVAAGHKVTAKAAEEILLEGGNAYDAIVAAFFAACVAEPVLASLAGGGYLLAQREKDEPKIYDFFVQTPAERSIERVPDFYPIHADFGATHQEFHIGLGSTAVPGCVRGMFRIAKELGTLPISRIVEPAIDAAREGVVVNRLQAEIFEVVRPIYESQLETMHIYKGKDGELIGEGELLKQPELADTLEALGKEGEQLFYEGEIAKRIVALCKQRGGYIDQQALKNYRVGCKRALNVDYRGNRLATNTAPAAGGVLLALGLKLLGLHPTSGIKHESTAHLELIKTVMAVTNRLRQEWLAENGPEMDERIFGGELLTIYREQIAMRSQCQRGTTHISVIDGEGNAAAMTVSNGEGCGTLIPGTGVMLNNMLGEEDINPLGFNCWQPNERMASMMAPGILSLQSGRAVVMGSGGSNRIRSAILQVISNMVDFGMTPEEAVEAHRVHFENGVLSCEPGWEKALQAYGAECEQQLWDKRSLFFGGVHCAYRDENGQFGAVGDPRRGGVGLVVVR